MSLIKLAKIIPNESMSRIMAPKFRSLIDAAKTNASVAGTHHGAHTIGPVLEAMKSITEKRQNIANSFMAAKRAKPKVERILEGHIQSGNVEGMTKAYQSLTGIQNKRRGLLRQRHAYPEMMINDTTFNSDSKKALVKAMYHGSEKIPNMNIRRS